MAITGVLPASGLSSRIGGIPKFCLPISDKQCLLQWHVEQMLDICDEIYVSTRSEWVPIVKNMEMKIKLIVLDPSTMSYAIKHMVGEFNNVLIGMPDTYILNSSKNIYKEIIKEDGADLVLGTWKCNDELKGNVGQIKIFNGRVVDSKDKVNNCNYKDMWGTMLFRNNMIKHLDTKLDHPGKQIKDWISEGFDIRAVKLEGQYIDVGTFTGLKKLYKEIDIIKE